MSTNLSHIQKIKENLETVAFLISKGGAEREAHGKIVQSLVLLSQLETELNGKCSYDSPSKPVKVSSSSVASKSYKNVELRNEIDDEINKVTRRLPRWFKNPSQYNSTILYNYLKLYEKQSDVSLRELRAECKIVNDFDGNYNQMKNFGEKNHGKVFEERDGYVTLWEPVKEFILEIYNENKA